jgi:calpain, invertebrate
MISPIVFLLSKKNRLYGSYEALNGGFPFEALLDFTGGVAETYQLKNPPTGLFQILLDSFRKSSLICSGIMVKDVQTSKAFCLIAFRDTTQETENPSMGLINNHAYSITCIKQVELKDHGKVQMIRLRNPWGTEAEWKGPWSDR